MSYLSNDSRMSIDGMTPSPLPAFHSQRNSFLMEVTEHVKWLREEHRNASFWDPKNNFEDEFKLLEIESKSNETMNETGGFYEKASKKNRYRNVVPYQNNRVRLSTIPGRSSSCDYINASHVNAEEFVMDDPTMKLQQNYIAAQGPLENSVFDFWRMVWEQDAIKIVCLAQVEENGKKKVEQTEHGDFQIVCKKKESYRDDIVISTLEISSRILDAKPRMVRHYHVLSWEDHGVPEIDMLRSLFLKLRDDAIMEEGPLVVHCSAGIGRTGTFLTCHIAWQRLAHALRDTGNELNADIVDVRDIVRTLRKCRFGMVTESDQFRFCYEFIYAECQHLIRVDASQMLARGAVFKLFSEKGDPVRVRVSLDTKAGTIFVEDVLKKKKKKYSAQDYLEITIGQQSTVWKAALRARVASKTAGERGLCFSLCGPKGTMDLQAESKMERDDFIDRLIHLGDQLPFALRGSSF